MSRHHHISRHLGWRAAALLLPGLLLAAPAHAEDAITTPAPAVQAQPPASPEAPIGHRQPRASDFPATTTGSGDPSDRWLNRVNRDIDRKLWICRNC